MSIRQLMIGKVGVASSTGSTPSITLDPATGTITATQICGQINISANVNWTEPDVDTTFRTLYLSDANVNVNSTADRLLVQLPNSNDVIKITFDGRIGRSSGVGAGDWVLGAPEVNNGYSFRINTSQPNLQLYAPDSGGQVALYNTSSTEYQWVIPPSGNATFNSVVSRGNIFGNANMTINGNLVVNGSISGVVQSAAVGVYVNANYTVPNDGNNYELLVNANDGVGAGNLIIIIPEDPTHQQEINIVVRDLGSAANIAVGDGSPELSFIGPGGLYTFVDLKTQGIGKTTLKYVNYGVFGSDWWSYA
jgi:hypothetical protein